MTIFTRRGKLLLVALALGVLYWVIESFIMVYIFHEGQIITQLFTPSKHESWQRLLVFMFMFGFAFHADFLLMKHKKADDAMRASEERYRQLVELSPDTIIIQCEDKVVFINPAGTRLFGAENPEQLLGKPIWDFALPENNVCKRYHQILDGELGTSTIELKFIQLDGTTFDAEMTDTPFVYQGKPAVQTIVHDTTARKQSEEQIRQRNKELATINAIATALTQSHDLHGTLNSALNEVLSLDLFGGEAKGMLFLLNNGKLSLAAHQGAGQDHPCLEKAPELGECLCGLAAELGETVISDNCWQNPKHPRRWPGMPPHKDICLPLKVHGAVLGVMNVRLPLEKVVNEGDVHLLTSVAGQVAIAIENARLVDLRFHAIADERERVARELHDGLAQLLGYINAKAAAVRKLLSKQDIMAAEKNLLQLEEVAQEVFVDVREAILGLKIAGLIDQGLATTIREFTTQFSRLTGLPVEVTITPQTENSLFDAEIELHLLRIIQEALSNIRKHASASQAWVSLQVENGCLELTVRDNGVGFAGEAGSKSGEPHFGLSTMQERAAAIGATLDIFAEPGAGTRIKLLMPVVSG